MLHEGRGLSSANLEGDPCAGIEVGAGFGDEIADERGPVRAAIERGMWIVTDLRREGGDLRGGDVGEVGDDEIVRAGYGGEEVALDEADAVREGEAGGVLGGKGEGGWGDVDCVDLGVWPLGGESECDHAGAGAGVEDAGGFGGGEGGVGDEELDEVLRLGARDQGAFVAEEGAAMELGGAQEMLQGLAGGAAFHEEAEGVEFAVAEGAVELEVEVDAFFCEDVRQEVLGVQAWALDAVFLEITGGGGEDLLHGFQIAD